MKKKLIFILFIFLFFEYSNAEIIVLKKKDSNNETFIPKKNTIEKLINKKTDLWYGVYISDNKVGWFNGEYVKVKDNFFMIEEEIFLSMSVPGNDGSKISMESNTKISMFYDTKSPYKLIKYDELKSDNEGNKYSKTGFVKNDKFYLTVKNNNDKNEYIIKNLSLSLNDHLSLDAWTQEKLRNKGDFIVTKFFDFNELSYLKYVFTVIDIINTKVNGLDYSYYKVNLDEKNTTKNIDIKLNAEYLIDLNGKYLNFSMLDIFDFRIEAEKDAKNFDENNKFFLDTGIILETGLPEEVFSKEIDAISYELIGDGEAIYNGGLQKVKKLSNNNYSIIIGSPLFFEKATKDEVSFYLKNTAIYPTKSEKIINLSERAIDNEKSDLLKLEKLINFVSEYIEDDYESNSDSVFNIIDNQKGDCTEHSLLFTTMARSIGLPTKEVIGWAYDGNKRYALHAWAEVAINIDGEFYWIAVDPTWNMINPLIHIKSSGEKFLSNNLTLIVKEIIFSDGKILKF